MSDLDVIIPVHNEAGSVEDLMKRIHDSLTSANINYKVIFIDDHSTDNTSERIRQVSKEYLLNPKVVFDSSDKYSLGSRVILYKKQGKKGKATAIIEGARISKAPYIAIIDGDLQYPPEAIPEMYNQVKNHGVIVANRKVNETSLFRKYGSKFNVLLFGKVLHGVNCDFQSGLKIFKRDIIDELRESEVTPWTLDLPLLTRALDLGYKIGTVDITFSRRTKDKSKVNYLNTGLEIAWSSLKLKLRKRRVFYIKPVYGSLLGAGVIYRGRKFITHTNLSHTTSALKTSYPWQSVLAILFLAILFLSLLLNTKITLISIIAFLSFIYFIDLLFSLYLLVKSLKSPPEIKVGTKDIRRLKNEELPVYTILCPLYKEANVLSDFVSSIRKLNWPKRKLDVLLLLEEDDEETIQKAMSLNLPNYMRVLVVPHSLPKTKPKACNYGLAFAKGEYLVIYDAEDRPDPLQLKKAFIAFKRVDSKVVCLQSKLNYYNTDQNLLTRLFTAEYSLWFDLVLPGLQSISTTIPLGGTSNHFRANALRYLDAWDPFNVTEDCDLGARLFKAGYKTAIIDSTTYEEANSRIGSWLKQRSRWVKGYLQTYLVHMRDPLGFLKNHGIHALIFQLVIGARMIFMLVNPILWFVTLLYFTLNRVVGPTIQSLYPTTIYYVAVFTLVFGNFIYLFNYMIGVAKRGQWNLVKYVFFMPFYWFLASLAAVKAAYQLLVKPHYWEKTRHGLHKVPEKLGSESKVIAERILPLPAISFNLLPFDRKRASITGFFRNLKSVKPSKISERFGKTLVGGGILITANLFVNLLNFLYNVFLGRTLNFEEFGLISALAGIFSLGGIFIQAVSKTISFKSAILLGTFKKPVKAILDNSRWIRPASILTTLVWLVMTPFLSKYLNASDILPFLLFSPVWIFSFLLSLNYGFLSGALKFDYIAYFIVIESVVKLALAALLVFLGYPNLVYSALPISIAVSYFISLLLLRRVENYSKKIKKTALQFPKKYYGVSVLSGLSMVAFLSVDVILAKHYLTSIQAGQYALLALSGKVIFLFGKLFSQFVNPVISKERGEGKDTRKTFSKLFSASALASIVGFIFIGLLGHLTVPVLFGSKTLSIVELLPVYTLGVASFSLANTISSYHQAREEYSFPVIGLLFAFSQVIYIHLFHSSPAVIATIVGVTGVAYFVTSVTLHYFYSSFEFIAKNIVDLFGLFDKSIEAEEVKDKGLRILIFNWRDTKHIWAGGAEQYIHELAKRWVIKGNFVTLFCGNDGLNAKEEYLDGVHIIRRGGFYTVYIFAFLYYLLKFRGKYDVIIDGENGIPFFTPLYTLKKKFLLIHHVHQDVFRKGLIAPLSLLATFLEMRLMPLIYKNVQVITVSPSSQKEIVLSKLTKHIPEVVYNGIDISKYTPARVSRTPMVLYLGRLKFYKSLDIFIKVAKKISEKLPDVKFVIAGSGEEDKKLKALCKELGLEKKIKFLGKVSEKKKVDLYQKAWVFVNPSLMEGWGITTIEANACGTPVVASHVPGLKDSVKNPSAGFLVPYGDVDGFAEKIEYLLENKRVRGKMSKLARNWAKRFSWDESADHFLRILQREDYSSRTIFPSWSLVFNRRDI